MYFAVCLQLDYTIFDIKKASDNQKLLDAYPQQDSNLYLEFRKLLFYPLNYEGLCAKVNI